MACHFAAGHDGALRCYPDRREVWSAWPAYVDSACSLPILYICAPAGVAQNVVRLHLPSLGPVPNFPDEYEYARVGAPMAAVTQFFLFIQGCDSGPRQVTPGCQAYSLEARIAFEDFAPERWVPQSEDSVSSVRLTREEPKHFEGSAWDRTLGIYCEFLTEREGTRRCYPNPDHTGWLGPFFLNERHSEIATSMCRPRWSLPPVVRWSKSAEHRSVAPDDYAYARLRPELQQPPPYLFFHGSRYYGWNHRCPFYRVDLPIERESFAVGIGYEFEDLPPFYRRALL